MAGFDLMLEIGEKTRLLDMAISQYGKRGEALAKAEQDYKVALAGAILSERDKGLPVTIINDVCRGKPSIAKLRFERDVAEAVYKAAQEAINNYKLQLRLLDAQISREWGKST